MQQSVGCFQALKETNVWAFVTHTIPSFFTFSVVSYTFNFYVITTCYSFLRQSVNLRSYNPYRQGCILYKRKPNRK